MEAKTKQILIGIGVVVGASVAGYLIYKKFISPAIQSQKSAPPVPQGPQQPLLPPGVPEGSIHVAKGEDVVAQASSVVNAKVKGDRYVKIEVMDNDEYGRTVVEFKSPVNGYFTGRVFHSGSNQYAEVVKA